MNFSPEPESAAGLKELAAKGLNSICFCFAVNYDIPLERKRGSLGWFAQNVMANFD